MKKFAFLPLIAVSLVLVACGVSEDRVRTIVSEEVSGHAETGAEAPQRSSEAETEAEPREEEILRYDMASFGARLGDVLEDPADFADAVMREERIEFRAFNGRELIPWDVTRAVQDAVHERILGETPQSISSMNWRTRGEYRREFWSARSVLSGLGRSVLSNPTFVRLIGDRVVSRLEHDGVDQRLFTMLRDARPALEQEFRLLSGADADWFSRFRSQVEGLEELPGTASMRTVCGETLPRNCVEAYFFLVRRHSDGGLENVQAWQEVGLAALATLEARPEFQGL